MNNEGGMDAKEQSISLWAITCDDIVYRHCTNFERLPNCIRFIDAAGFLHIINFPYRASEEL